MTYNTTANAVETRLSALTYADAVARYRAVDGFSSSAEELVADAKVIEAYLTAE